MVYENARLHAKQHAEQVEKEQSVLGRLAELLQLEVLPLHIEAYDISNLGSEHVTAGKISIKDGKFDKKHYRTYKITDRSRPDDYAAMQDAITRRLSHSDEDPLPDLILLDGGKGHVSTIRASLQSQGVTIPVYGMVKDDFHKTRALTGENDEISIAKEQAVFQFIYRIQEEVHRFTIKKMTNAKRKTLTHSSLEAIPGIGPAKAKALLKHFGTLTILEKADKEALLAVPGISEKQANAILAHFTSRS